VSSLDRYYVRRSKDGRVNWVGPFANIAKARDEYEAWRAGGWDAWIHMATPQVRAWVQAWEKEKRERKKATG
jgi:hypothetical protein